MSIKIHQAKAFIASITGYELTNDAIVLEAIDTTGMRSHQSNQRLALLGDKIMGFIVAEAWFASGASKGMLHDD